jgi:hypothetical protein
MSTSYRHPERVRVRPKVGVDLRGQRMEGVIRGRGVVGERRHRAARVRPHPGPHAAVRGGRVPLAAECVVRLEDRHVEAGFERVLGGREPGRARPDDRDPCAVAQPHALALLSDWLRENGG